MYAEVSNSTIGIIVIVVIAVIVFFSSFKTIEQGKVGVVTIFGKYRRVLRPGLNWLIPFIEKIQSKPSLQNQSVELGFQAITADQANVHFAAMLLYAPINDSEETIKAVAFKFVNDKAFMTALARSIEGSVRGFVATKKQNEILALRSEIVAEVKAQLDETLETWGYHLIDVQLNDVTFDAVITDSMARVVASNNLKAAATNEGDALLIRRTKEAEAEGAAIRIAAEAEKLAAQLRGQGVALFRQEVARGLTEAATQMESQNVDPSLILFAMWTETVRQMAEVGRGNVMFLDGSPDSMRRTLHELAGMKLATDPNFLPPPPPPPDVMITDQVA
ncbi:MAG: SPFH domain-containing protein [Acidimicrobiia bacterium]